MPLSATARIPASTANLGPGFDCLGLALDLYNTVELSVAVGTTVSPTCASGTLVRSTMVVSMQMRPMMPQRRPCTSTSPRLESSRS